MKGRDLKAIRQRVAPDMPQRAFARALGYSDERAYAAIEHEERPVSPLLERLMKMIDRHGLPDDWR